MTMRLQKFGILLVVCGISFALVAPVEALVTFPDPVPNDVSPGDAQVLKRMYDHLQQVGNDLEKRLIQHNAQCRLVKVGSPEDRQCVKMKDQLSRQWGNYEELREKYNKTAKLAQKAKKEKKSPEGYNKANKELESVSSILKIPRIVSPAPGSAGPARAGSVANAKKPEAGPAKAGPVANRLVTPPEPQPNR